jgi:hypothetical protein
MSSFGKTATIFFGISQGKSGNEYAITTGLIAFRTHIPVAKNLVGVEFSIHGASGTVYATDLVCEIRPNNPNTNLPDMTTVLASGTAITPNTDGVLPAVSSIPVRYDIRYSMQPLTTYWFVFKNVNPNPTANYISITYGHYFSEFFTGSEWSGFGWATSNDGGSTWPSWGMGQAMTLIFDDGSVMGFNGYYNFGGDTYGRIYGEVGRAGFLFKTPDEGRMRVCCVNMGIGVGGTPASSVMEISTTELPEDPSSVVATGMPVLVRTTSGQRAPNYFLSPSDTFIFEPGTRYLVYWRSTDTTTTSADCNLIRIGSVYPCAVNVAMRGRYFWDFVPVASTTRGNSWTYAQNVHIPLAILVLDPDDPFAHQSSLPPTDPDTVLDPTDDYQMRSVNVAGAGIWSYNLAGSGGTHLIPFGVAVISTTPKMVDEYELYVDSTTGAPMSVTASVYTSTAAGVPNQLLATTTFTVTGAGWYNIPLTGYYVESGKMYYLAFNISPTSSTMALRSVHGIYSTTFCGSPYRWDGTTLTRGYSSYLSTAHMFRIGSQWYGSAVVSGVTLTYPKIGLSYQLPAPIDLMGVSLYVGPVNVGVVRVGLYETSNWFPTNLIEQVEINATAARPTGSTGRCLITPKFSQPRRVQNFCLVFEPGNGSPVTGVEMGMNGQSNITANAQRVSRTHSFMRGIYYSNNTWNTYLLNNDIVVNDARLIPRIAIDNSGGGSSPAAVVPVVIKP